MADTHNTPASFSDLLEHAIAEPGIVHEAYSRFHNYSIGNQLLALMQCHARGLQPGPIATFPKWKELGRYVKRGEKAITLCQPVTCKRRTAAASDGQPSDEHLVDEQTFTRFTYRPRWFVLAQTNGAAFTADAAPLNWDAPTALERLNIVEIAFDVLDGNVWGFARGRDIAVSPLSPLPMRTRLHELAHVILGHTSTEHQDGPTLARNEREVEAEATAYLCAAVLNLEGLEYSRGYLQHWLGAGNRISERSAQRIMKAADTILRAGRPHQETPTDGAETVHDSRITEHAA